MSTKSVLSYLSADAFESEMQKLALIGKGKLPKVMLRKIFTSRDISFERGSDTVANKVDKSRK